MPQKSVTEHTQHFPNPPQKPHMVAANDLNPCDEILVLGETRSVVVVQVIQATGRVRIVLDDDKDFEVSRGKCFPLVRSWSR